MNWDTMQGKWNEMSGAVKAKWAKLTDDDLKLVGGKFDELVGRLQQRYGHTRDEAERQVNDFVKSVPTQPQNKPKA
jgi:uncharacterized protein YjbJ (UPF0337 family)